MESLKIFIFLSLVNNSSLELLPIHVSTISNLEFTLVRSFITGPTGDLIIIDNHAIFHVNIKADPPTRRLITGQPGVGEDKRGYKEGASADSRFTLPFDLKLKNETTLLVADTENHCLRTVDLSTGTTALYAGIGKVNGFMNGNRLNAEFKRPAGMLKLADKTYIVDFGNHAIRMLESDIVTTLLTSSLLQGSAAGYMAASIDKFIYLTIDHGIVRINPVNANAELIVGSTSEADFKNAYGLLSRFNNPAGITHLDDHTLAVADWYNARVRFVDLHNGKVGAICSGAQSQLNGNQTQCSFHTIWSVFVYEDSLLIGDFTLMRRLPLYSIIDVMTSSSSVRRENDEEVEQVKVSINKPIFKSAQIVVRFYQFIAEEVQDTFKYFNGSVYQDRLVGYGDSVKNDLWYYISGEIPPKPDDERIKFSYGDGLYYNGYHNIELKKSSAYRFHYLIQYELEGQVLTEFVKSTDVFKPKQQIESKQQGEPKQRSETVKLEYLSLLSLLVLLVIIVVVILCKRRRREAVTEEGGRLSIREYENVVGKPLPPKEQPLEEFSHEQLHAKTTLPEYDTISEYEEIQEHSMCKNMLKTPTEEAYTYADKNLTYAANDEDSKVYSDEASKGFSDDETYQGPDLY